MANPNQEIVYTKLFINNQFVDSQSGKKFATLNPVTGETLAEVAEADKADVDLAVRAAKKAFERGSPWRNMDASGRGRLINKRGWADHSLELSTFDGKSPLLIMEDVDLDEVVQIAHDALFANPFIAKSVELTRQRKVGNPFADGVLQGPQIESPSQEKILKYIDLGTKQGAKLEIGGKKWGDAGFFVEPTIFSNVTDNMAIAQDEIFGPVQSILKFKTLEEVIERSNASSYGLAAGILTKNIDTALTFARAVEASSVWINCYDATMPQTPFGGYKQSGFGRELGEDGLEPYLETKTILIKLPTKN